MRLETFVRALLPRDFVLSQRGMDMMLNTFKDKSLIINDKTGVDKTYNVKVDSLSLKTYCAARQCARCKKVPTHSPYNQMKELPKHWNSLPKVPCPSCHELASLQMVVQYLCPTCVDGGSRRNIPKILCYSCKADDVTDATKGAKYFTVNDYMYYHLLQRRFSNSGNRLFQLNDKYLKPLREEHRKRMLAYLRKQKEIPREDAETRDII